MQVRRWRVAALLAKPEGQPAVPYHRVIPGRWGAPHTAAPAAEGTGLLDGQPLGGTLPPLQRSPSALGGLQEAGSGAAMMSKERLTLQPSWHGGWLDPSVTQQMDLGPPDSQSHSQPGLLERPGQPAAQVPAHLPPPSWHGAVAAHRPGNLPHPSDGASAPVPRSPARRPSGALPLPAEGGGGEAPSMRLRSDRPFQTASEAERRARAQADFQAALCAQVEERARLKAEERRRRVPAWALSPTMGLHSG